MATCFDPQGRNISNADSQFPWYPCNFTSSDGFVPCCQPGLGGCLQNLGCAYSSDVIIRGGCTDFTFRSKNCPQFLLEPNPPPQSNYIHNCGNGTGCYNISTQHHSDNNCSCALDAPNPVLLIFSNSIVYANRATTTTTTSPTSTLSGTGTVTTTSSSQTTNTRSTTSNATQSAAPSSSSNLGVKVGVPVGIVGGLAVLGIAFFLWRRKKANSSTQTPVTEPHYGQHQQGQPYVSEKNTAELSGRYEPHQFGVQEVDGRHMPRELEA